MKAILNWTKSNPVIIICAVTFVCSLGLVGYVMSAGGDFTESMKKVNGQINELKSLMLQNVQIPPEKPDGLPRFPKITVNQHAINDLRDAYTKMNGEYEGIFKFSIQHNQAQHLEMIEGIFPDPGFVAARPFDAKERYRLSLREVFEPFSPTAGYPQIDAKPPISAQEINAALDRVEKDYLEGNFLPPKTRAQLTPQEAERLKELQARKHIDVLLSHAKSTHIYAQTDPGLPGFPFEILSWSAESMSRPPSNIEIWDGQMALWIQQDICRAIQIANKVETPASNVMNAPVKQLISVRVDPKYIGLTKDDALDVARRIPDDFSLSMSGRYCNPLYDVRHVYVSLIVDSKRMPEFFNALSQVNFMTVIGMKVTDVDEYEMVRQGYVFGPVDCVKLDMQIESIWLREWTMKLMPKDKKIELGIPEKKAAPAAPK